MDKKFNVYGIGNALVDIDFETTEETLNQLKIEKGVMTLIDGDRHIQLLEDLVGVKHVKAGGGSAANTIMAVTQLGGKAFYSCRVSNDESGDFFLQELKRNGITTNLTNGNRPHGSTGSCLVLVTPDADRTMNTFLGVSEHFSIDDLCPEGIAASEYLYIEGYLASSPTGSEAAILANNIAKQSNTKIAISLSDPNMVRYFHARLLEMINGKVDFLFCNEEEARMFCQTNDLSTVCQTLSSVSNSFAITQGPRGSLIFDGENFYDIDAHEVPVIDTVGAGDMYAGGFLYAITHSYDFETSGVIADIVASKVISKFGPRLNNLEVQEVKAEIQDLLNIII